MVQLKLMSILVVNKDILHSIDLTIGPSHGILDNLGSIVQHPLFGSVVNNIINKVLVKHGLPSDTKVYNPDMTGEDVLGGVRSLLVNHLVKEKVVAVQKASGISISDVLKIPIDVLSLPKNIKKVRFVRPLVVQEDTPMTFSSLFTGFRGDGCTSPR